MKVRHFVTTVIGSHKRWNMLTAAQIGLKEHDPTWSFGTLNRVRDGEVRCYSTYLMLRRCFELKDSISCFQREMRLSLHLDDLGDSEEEKAWTEEDDEDKDGNQPIWYCVTRIPYDPFADTIMMKIRQR